MTEQAYQQFRITFNRVCWVICFTNDSTESLPSPKNILDKGQREDYFLFNSLHPILRRRVVYYFQEWGMEKEFKEVLFRMMNESNYQGKKPTEEEMWEYLGISGR